MIFRRGKNSKVKSSANFIFLTGQKAKPVYVAISSLTEAIQPSAIQPSSSTTAGQSDNSKPAQQELNVETCADILHVDGGLSGGSYIFLFIAVESLTRIWLLLLLLNIYSF